MPESWTTVVIPQGATTSATVPIHKSELSVPASKVRKGDGTMFMDKDLPRFSLSEDQETGGTVITLDKAYEDDALMFQVAYDPDKAAAEATSTKETAHASSSKKY